MSVSALAGPSSSVKPVRGGASTPASQTSSISNSAASSGAGSVSLAGIGVLVGLIALVGLVGGGVYLLRGRSSGAAGDGRPPQPIVPERQYDWELRLSEEQERAMLAGIQAYRDAGHRLYLSHREATLRFYEPYAVVSLHRVSEALVAAGGSAMAEPASTMRNILDGFLGAESPGVLHLRKAWYPAAIDGLDNQKFAHLCYELMTNPQPYLEGTAGSGADEGSGLVEVHVDLSG